MGFVIAYKTVEQCVFPNETTQSGPSGHGRGGIATPSYFERYVNPITTKESGRLCPPQYNLLPPQDFQTFQRL